MIISNSILVDTNILVYAADKNSPLELEKYLEADKIEKIYPGINFMDFLISILKRYKISGQEIFDAQLAALMLSNGVSKIYTFNKKHFSIFKEIEVLDL